MASDRPDFVPALGISWLTPLYDPVMKVLGEDVFNDRLVKRLGDEPVDRILDLGCGTATGTLKVKQSYPSAQVVGVEIDPEVLARARSKSEKNGLEVELVESSATELPFEAESFDAVISNLVFHHLDAVQKGEALQEVRRVLRPGGRLLLADFSDPHGPVMRGTFFVVQIFDGFDRTAPHVRGELGAMIEDAGFEEVQVLERRRSLLGSQSLFLARR